MHKLSAHRATIYWVLVVLIFFIPSVSGCGGSGIQGLENAGNTVDGSSVSKSLYSADKDKSSKQCLYSKVTYTLDNGKIITYQFDPNTLSAVTPSKSSSQDSSSSSTQETRSSGVTRQAYDGTVMGLGDSKAAYVTDKLVATTNAYTFSPGAGIAEEYIVCPEPSVYPENNVTRQGVTVVPSIESGLGPITYTPTAPSFTGAVHIVANYIIPDDPPKPWHESWEYVYLVDDPVPVLTYYYSEDGNVMGLQFTMGIGSDTENVVLPRTLGGWHFISNNNMSHSDDIMNMRELSIKDPVTFVADNIDPNKIKVQAGIEELPTGSWTANIARAKDVIVDPDTQETSTIDLIWDPIEKYIAGDWIYNSGVITAALSKGFSLTVREIANFYMHTIIAYEDTVKTFAMKSAEQAPKQFSIKNVLVSPTVFKPYDEKITITADIEATGFTPTNLYWEIKITDNNGNTIKTLAGGTNSSIRAIWDGLKDDGSYACGDADNIFKLDDQGQIIRPEYTSITYKGSYNIKISASCNEDSTTSSTTVNVDHRPLEVFPYDQDDSRWGNTNYDHFAVGDVDHTISKVGCALTSVAMLIAYHNRLFGGLIANPLNLNNALIQNNGYTTTNGDGKGSIIWRTISACCKHIGLVTNVKYKRFPNYDPNIVKSELENGRPCIVDITLPDPTTPKGIHFVLVKGTMGKDKHIINDPGFKKYYEDRTGIGVRDLYLEDYLQNSSQTKIDAVALFEPITGIWPFKSLGISCSEDSGGNVEYALIDPLGRYIGYNPTRNIITSSKSNVLARTDIPDAQYFCKPWTSIDNTSELIGGAKNLWVYKPIEGVYILKVFGTNASSHYWLDIGSDHPDENSVLVNGFVTPGQVVEYSINFSQTAGTIPVVSLNEFINGSLELEPATLNLNSNGNYVTAHISLPTGYNVQNIDIASLRLENSIPALSHPTATCDHNKLMVKFDRQALIDYIKSKGITSGKVTLTVTGNIGSNSFRASGKIRVK